MYHSLRSTRCASVFSFLAAGNSVRGAHSASLASAWAIRYSMICAPRREHRFQRCRPCVLLSARRASPRERVSARRLCLSQTGAAAPFPFVNVSLVAVRVSASQCRRYQPSCHDTTIHLSADVPRRCGELHSRLLRSFRPVLLGSEPIQVPMLRTLPQNFAKTSATASFKS